MVTARFLVGTKADEAILRVHEKIRANIDRIPVGIPEPLIVGRGINDVAIVVLTLSPKPAAAERYTDKDLYRSRRQAAFRAHQGRQCRPDLHRRRRCAADPCRARPGEARALRRDAAATRRQGARRQPLVPGGRGPRRRHRRARLPRGRRSRAYPTSGCCWSRPATAVRSMCATSPERRAGAEPGRAPRLERVRAATRARGRRTPAVSARDRQARRRQRGRRRGRSARADRQRSKGRLIPADVAATVTRDYGETANEKANELLFHLGARHRLDRGADRVRDRLARGRGDARGHSRRRSCSRCLRPI